MDDLDALVAEKVAASMADHSLREAARRVSLVRVELGNIARLPELPADLVAEARRLHDNGVENLLWHLEQRLNSNIK